MWNNEYHYKGIKDYKEMTEQRNRLKNVWAIESRP